MKIIDVFYRPVFNCQFILFNRHINTITAICGDPFVENRQRGFQLPHELLFAVLYTAGIFDKRSPGALAPSVNELQKPRPLRFSRFFPVQP
jgi:hypothetical protein